jgi:hypothetical protein
MRVVCVNIYVSPCSNFLIIFGSDDDHNQVNLYHGPCLSCSHRRPPLSVFRHDYLRVSKAIDIVVFYIKTKAHIDFIYEQNIDHDAAVYI